MKTLLQQPLHNSFSKNRSKCRFVANMETIEQSDVHTTATMKPQDDTNKTSALPTCRFCKESHSFDTCKHIAALPFWRPTSTERVAYVLSIYAMYIIIQTAEGRALQNLSWKTSDHLACSLRNTRNVQSTLSNVASTAVNACYDLPSDDDQSSDCTVENIMAIMPVKVRVQGSTVVIYGSWQ
ncbi:hypothetical protein LSH36_415g00004 [Paralvinella palmiformis]|uniref:Uncharacterized protein n=1 Tax=Paralvinella palmiformis TaxID=53620 RepID=A0AAD9JCC5_9ANNE|nr:hypothetical protein LSH36_415g00004 [Paralvinella palmiformis]